MTPKLSKDFRQLRGYAWVKLTILVKLRHSEKQGLNLFLILTGIRQMLT